MNYNSCTRKLFDMTAQQFADMDGSADNLCFLSEDIRDRIVASPGFRGTLWTNAGRIRFDFVTRLCITPSSCAAFLRSAHKTLNNLTQLALGTKMDDTEFKMDDFMLLAQLSFCAHLTRFSLHGYSHANCSSEVRAQWLYILFPSLTRTKIIHADQHVAYFVLNNAPRLERFSSNVFCTDVSMYNLSDSVRNTRHITTVSLNVGRLYPDIAAIRSVFDQATRISFKTLIASPIQTENEIEAERAHFAWLRHCKHFGWGTSEHDRGTHKSSTRISQNSVVVKTVVQGTEMRSKFSVIYTELHSADVPAMAEHFPAQASWTVLASGNLCHAEGLAYQRTFEHEATVLAMVRELEKQGRQVEVREYEHWYHYGCWLLNLRWT